MNILVQIFWYHFQCVFDELLFTHSPCETLFFDDSRTEVHDSTYREKWFSLIFIIFSLPVLASFVDAFRHRLWLHVATTLAYNSSFRCDWFLFNNLKIGTSLILMQHDSISRKPVPLPIFLSFSVLFRRWCSWRILGSLWYPFSFGLLVFLCI